MSSYYNQYEREVYCCLNKYKFKLGFIVELLEDEKNPDNIFFNIVGNSVGEIYGI